MLNRVCMVRSSALRDRERFICLSTGPTAHKCLSGRCIGQCCAGGRTGPQTTAAL